LAFALWSLAACNAPDLDTTGRIECGSDPTAANNCPSGFECRAGRCCPTGSAPNCPGHIVGGACTSADDCDAPNGSTPVCLTTAFGFLAPTGYCSHTCDPSSASTCPTNSTCRHEPVSNTNLCFANCNSGGATGYIGPCPMAPNGLACFGAMTGSNAGLCLPDCGNSDTQCSARFKCVNHACRLRCSTVGGSAECTMAFGAGWTCTAVPTEASTFVCQPP
jgi:hypothetical protein